MWFQAGLVPLTLLVVLSFCKNFRVDFELFFVPNSAIESNLEAYFDNLWNPDFESLIFFEFELG